MKKISYLIISLSAAITLLIFIYLSSSEYTLVVLGFVAWALSPYLYLFGMVRVSTNKNKKFILGSVLSICLLGVVLLINTAFLGINAQGGLALLFIPVYQWVVLVLITVVIVLLKVKNA